jgi:hypothetical protein
MNCSNDNLEDYIETTINAHEREHMKDRNVNRLHDKRHLLKIWVTHSLVKVIGYENVFDPQTIQGFPYEKVRQFMIEHGYNIDILFGCNSNKNWKNLKLVDIDTKWSKDKIKEVENENKDMKKSMTAFVNNRLKSVCNISVKNKCRGRGSIKEEYTIQGLDIWKKGNIKLLNNTKADLLHLHKNFKRLMTKTQVEPKIWKCISELVAIESK